LYPLAGGEPQTVKGLQEGELPIQWDTTGTKLYVWDRTFPAHVFLVDLRSGKVGKDDSRTSRFRRRAVREY